MLVDLVSGGAAACRITYLVSGTLVDRFRKTNHSRNVNMTVRMIDDEAVESVARDKNPEESAFETKTVVRESEVKMSASMPRTRMWSSALVFLLPSVTTVSPEDPADSVPCCWEMARKCDSHVVGSSCFPGGDAYMDVVGVGGVKT